MLMDGFRALKWQFFILCKCIGLIYVLTVQFNSDQMQIIFDLNSQQ